MAKTDPTARRRSIDVGARQVGAVYAKALLSAAEKAGQVERVIADVDAIVTEALDPNPAFERVLGSALIKHEEKAALLDRVFGQHLSPLVLDFLKVVSRHGRLNAMRGIQLELHKQYDERRGLVRVRMSTATAVGGELLSSLRQTLTGLLGNNFEVEQHVDPKLIGGVVLRVGDTVYDGSVARQLAQVREQMIDRSVHEIQSRRDRFRTSGGN